MATPPMTVLLLLLLALLLPTQTCTEPTNSSPTPTATLIPEGNTSESRALPGIELRARASSPVPGPLALLAPLALWLVLG